MAKVKTRRDYGSGSVHQRSSDGMWIGTYEAGWTAKGKRRRITASAMTEAKCKVRLRQKIDEYKSGGASTMSDRTTVKAYSEKWLEKTSKKVRPKTWATNRSAVTQWIIPTIGHRRLRDLHADDVQAVQDAQEAKGRAASTMTRTHAVLLKMLRDATVDGATIHAGVFNADKAGVGESDREAMDFPDALAMLRLIEQEPDPSRWVGVILNGVRQAERLGLTWSMVDFENHVVDISWQLQELPYRDNQNKHLGFRVPIGFESRQIQGRFHLTRPKTASGRRIIPMTKWFEASLLRWREEAHDSRHGLVWCREDGKPISEKEDRAAWYALQERINLHHPTRKTKTGEPAPYHVHEGRHTTVTMLKELGIDDEVIEQIVGQTKLVKAYAHHNLLPKSRQALEQLADRLAITD